MDTVANSRKKHVSKKANKENTQPAHDGKSFIKRDETKVAPFHLKSNEQQETFTKNGHFKTKTKQVDTGSISAEALKRKIVQKDRKAAGAGAVASDVKITAAEFPKPPTTTSFKSAPGLYKGKIVQSKIGSIWKSNVAVSGEEPKLSAPKAESQRNGNVTKSRSKSVSDLPRCGTQKPASKSVFSRPTVMSRPPVKTVQATLTRTSSRDATVVTTKASGIHTSKQKITMTDKVTKPSVSSKISQYRLTMETTEQRRAKLAEWLASKGKTLKRPAMTASALPKTKVSAKPRVDQEFQCRAEPQPTTECIPNIKQSAVTNKLDSATVAHCADTHEAQLTVHSQTLAVMDTTLELLENSDADVLMDASDGVDNVVVNLCKDFEAMDTPSRSNDELAQGTDKHETVEIKEPKMETKKENMPDKTQDFEENQAVNQVDTDEDDEVESGKADSTPHVGNASVVKYSVKTTPYLQSVKKTIEGEGSTNPSRRKSNIKDLKFLTPVRRSCRIQSKSSHLPPMLVDHDPCVSSLAELVKLDDDPNAYIYRKNSALLEDLPDQPGQ